MNLRAKKLIATRYGYEISLTSIDDGGVEHVSTRDYTQANYSSATKDMARHFVAYSDITKITASVTPKAGAVENSIESFGFRVEFESSLDGTVESGNAIVSLNACEYYEVNKLLVEALAQKSSWIPYSFDIETNTFTLKTIYQNDPTETVLESNIVIVDSNYRRDFREFLDNLEQRLNTQTATACYR